MDNVLVIITAFFAIAAVAGFGWILATRGKATPRRDLAPESVASMGEVAIQPDPTGEAVVQPDPTGEAVVQPDPTAEPAPAVSDIGTVGEAGARNKREPLGGLIIAAIRAGKIRQVLPPLLAILGLIGVTFFGGLTMIVRSSNYLIGLPLIGFSLYTGYLIFSGSMRRK